MVLGCTHYPFVRPMIQKIFGNDVAIFDGGGGTARELRRRMKECGILNTTGKNGTVRIENSKETPEVINLCEKLLSLPEVR